MKLKSFLDEKTIGERERENLSKQIKDKLDKINKILSKRMTGTEARNMQKEVDKLPKLAKALKISIMQQEYED